MFSRDCWEHRPAGCSLQGTKPPFSDQSHHYMYIGSEPRHLDGSHWLLVFQVKADRSNKKLNTLQQASRHVNDMAAVVVTSTKHGQKQISDHGETRSRTLKFTCLNLFDHPSPVNIGVWCFVGIMDFSGMSLIKLKREEMEAQVRKPKKKKKGSPLPDERMISSSSGLFTSTTTQHLLMGN